MDGQERIPWVHEYRYPDEGWTIEACLADERAHRPGGEPYAEGWRVWSFRAGRPDEGSGPGELPAGPIVDFHAHAWVDSFVPRVRERMVGVSGVTPFDPGTLEGLCRRKRLLGVTRTVVLPVPTNERQVARYNDWLAGYLDDPDLIPFMGVYPHMPGAADEVRRCAALGFKGLKLHPINQRFRMSDPRLFPVYEAAIEAGMVILFHTGPDLDHLASGPDWDCSAAEISRFYDRYPYKRAVMAHLGGMRGFFAEAPELHPEWPGYLDLAFALGRVPDRELLGIVRAYGADRVLFATDSPWEWTADFLERMAHIGFDEGELRAILYDNAAGLLGLAPRAQEG